MSKEFRVTNKELLTVLLPKIDELKNQYGLKSDGEILAFLVDKLSKQASYNGVVFSNSDKPTGYEVTEKQLIDFATQNLPIERLFYKGALAEAKRIYSESHNDNRVRKNRAESLQKIIDAVDNQMRINQQGEKSTQRFISSAWIQKVTGCNYNAIAEFLLSKQAEIDKHHAELGINEKHNRRVLNEAKRAIKDNAKTTSNDDND